MLVDNAGSGTYNGTEPRSITGSSVHQRQLHNKHLPCPALGGGNIKRLLKAIAMLGFSQLATAFVSIVRNKIIAVILGPEGVGLFAQLQSLQNLAANAVPMGMQAGALKYFAKLRVTDREALPSYVATAGRSFLGLSIVTAVGCLVFIKPLSAWALDSASLFTYMIPAILGVPFMIQTTLWNAYLQSGLEMKTYSKTILTSSFFGLIIAVPLVYTMQQRGASIHLFAAAVIGFVVVRFYVKRAMDPKLREQIKTAKFDPQVVRTLVRFGGANIPGFSLWILVPFLVRTQIIRTLGLDQNGIYQAVFAIAANYLSVPINALSTYQLPKLSQNLDDVNEINAEVNRNLKIAFLINATAILFVLLTSGFLVHALFSKKFLAAVVLFPWQMAGDYCKSIVFAVGAPLVPQERFFARNVLAISQHAIYLIVFFLLLPHLHLMGVVIAHFVGWSYALVSMYIYLNRVNGFRFDKGNWRLLTISVLAFGVVVLSLKMGGWWRLMGWTALATWMATAPTREDRAKLVATVKARISRATEQLPAEEAKETAATAGEKDI